MYILAQTQVINIPYLLLRIPYHFNPIHLEHRVYLYTLRCYKFFHFSSMEKDFLRFSRYFLISPRQQVRHPSTEQTRIPVVKTCRTIKSITVICQKFLWGNKKSCVTFTHADMKKAKGQKKKKKIIPYSQQTPLKMHMQKYA